MNDYLVFGLFFVAIAIGWYLGRRGQGKARVRSPDLPGQYYRGLNYLLDGRPDGAVDAFINALEVNSETLETHIALGNLLRKRGEVDRAIRIHQNLLARPSLPRSQVHQAHLELARDYISAGLLDRAERLLLDLVQESSTQRRASQWHLLDIYQSEREWQQAIDTARQLLPRKGLLGSGAVGANEETGQSVPVVLSHYYCELAAERHAAGDLQTARSLLQEAIHQDRQCVRASLMLGEVEYDAGRCKPAIKALRRIRQQDPLYISESVPTLRKCYRELGEEKSLLAYLRDCLDSDPSPPLLLAAAEDIREMEGLETAETFVVRQLEKMPSLRGLEKLISLQGSDSEGKAREDLELVQQMVQRLIEERPSYRCSHCGFAARDLHWFCLGCKYWGTVRPIRGTSME
ncbi:lipopolysaccharide assembly protein LapB [Seongchinamella sediminis]|uniref:Lipopolysaccharide assembly protein B n=1 Tax=Seongchinamella sediminis TaxID=2283635 RepID=A0A3L7E168_9GAMM|nr:lipopolysaccharide assembly protein LapB [Seongchinamella sediminis]RLQ22699.1 lipopolysaccharide assembly protein LapB [Seongchinamella sediminis]